MNSQTKQKRTFWKGQWKNWVTGFSTWSIIVNINDFFVRPENDFYFQGFNFFLLFCIMFLLLFSSLFCIFFLNEELFVGERLISRRNDYWMLNKMEFFGGKMKALIVKKNWDFSVLLNLICLASEKSKSH
jgi:hypothetical protein